jgi:transcriptional regulator with XRE-family HTH domain
MRTERLTSSLVDALKKLLKSRGATYRDLARALKLSEPSIKRLFSERTFTLNRLEQVCAFLEIDFFELAKLARGAAAAGDHMTIEQEQVLAADPRLLAVFYLLFNDWSLEDILARHMLTRAEAIKLALKLEHAGLVDLLPGDKARLKVPKSVRLRDDGPIRRAHGKRVIGAFIDDGFAASDAFLSFEIRELSPASAALLQRRLERVAAEFNELAELDSYLPSGRRKTIGMVLALRPWAVAWAMGLKPRPPPEPPRRN